MVRTVVRFVCKRISLMVLVGVLVAPLAVFAQEATLRGTLSDSSGGVLPGVTVTAVHTASGNTFVSVTDGQGEFQLPLRTGAYQITFDLPGFATITRSVELLVGQQATINLQMAPSSLQETLTVTGEAPLLDTTSSTLGSNIDPRQLQELPVSGRSWQNLALLTSGSRSNAIQNDLPVERAIDGGYQINVDGQQITQVVSTNFGNPKFSRDAIAEFEVVSNRFDVSQGRSTGVQVNAITKSGTNNWAGSIASYFRDDRFNAADHVVDRVLPYSNQQISTTVGGPIQKDRMHFFANYEYEREPETFTFTTPYTHFNQDQPSTREEYAGGGRFDLQFSPQTRLSIRANTWRNYFPFGAGGASAANSSTATIASALETERWMNQTLGTLTKVIGDRAVNEFLLGYASYNWDITSVVHTTYPASLRLPEGAPTDLGAPRVVLRGGLTIGPGHAFAPQEFRQRTFSVRDNFSYKYGKHNLKLGGEYLHYPTWQYFCNYCFGQLDADIAPIPANIEAAFPDLLDANTWNLGSLSPIAVRWRQGFGDVEIETPRYVAAGWAQDDWAITPHLTLNLGVRYDLQLNVFSNDVEILPFMPGGRPNDVNNFGPRVGAVYTLNDRTVLRGGFGKFYGDITDSLNHYSKLYAQTILAEVLYDGRADFGSNPFNGPTPTYEQLQANICTPANPTAAGCIRRAIASPIPSPNFEIPYSYQSSIGVQRQLGSTMSVSADYVYTAGRKERNTRNVNLGYNPDTQANYSFSDLSRRPFPDWGAVALAFNEGYSNAHGLETTFSKRFSKGWQLSANYTLAGFWDFQPAALPGVALSPDLAGEYTLAATDQRHRAVVNGVWEVGKGFQMSGLYFFGSGQRFSTTWGPDLRNVGGVGGTNRLRPDGTVVPRNNFVGEPIHRVDMRLQQRVPVGRQIKVDGVFEVFNLFNHANFGSYVTQESNARYGQPNLNLNVAYLPRTLQLGFRVAF